MKYLCLAFEEQSDLDGLSQDDWIVLRKEVLDYVDELRKSGKLLDARPLQSASKAAVVRVRGGEVQVTDGPFIETKEQLGGYFLLEVTDREEALRIAAGWPSARFGTIEVRPLDEELRTESRY